MMQVLIKAQKLGKPPKAKTWLSHLLQRTLLPIKTFLWMIVLSRPLDQIFCQCAPNIAASIFPVKALLYQLAPNTQLLPDFAAMSPVKTVCLKQLNIANRDFKDGFPGVDNLIEWFFGFAISHRNPRGQYLHLLYQLR